MTTMTVDELHRQGYEMAETIAPTWESRREEVEEVATPIREWMIGSLAPQPGETVLELAAGVGETGFELARRLGPDGRLISSDFSPAMLDAARRRGGELGVENVDYRVIDAAKIELETDSVDGVLCRFGYMLMADPGAALSETRRVLRSGGRLALAVWGSPERNPFFAILAMTLVQRGHAPPPDPEAPGIFAMASEERTRGLLAAAGFDDVRIEEVPVRFAVPGIDEYLTFVADTAGPVALALRGVGDGERKEIAAQLEQAFAPFAADDGDGYELPGVALCAAAS